MYGAEGAELDQPPQSFALFRARTPTMYVLVLSAPLRVHVVSVWSIAPRDQLAVPSVV